MIVEHLHTVAASSCMILSLLSLQLDYLTMAQLKVICKGLSVTVGGNKAELILKIKDKLS